ncbi:putative nonribosomal peptide synthase [Aspergillus homomorphus CBS 101889]|uniref:Putative nonribosomal peptide synthase n=1 Tax=Aspergillus homomorphus (strain CBS 101889) TaxID=1450537 RepID=A0A395HFI4_ASPHC|nr:putative nonribosomal peptide synthase [Aspergillus homomorphus CBS 101889]RAL06662.1 putative nonribosomal peptide synthase [Aspergillus homomorphus CBS 101889]
MASSNTNADHSAQFWKNSLASMEISRLSHLVQSYEGEAQWTSCAVNAGIKLQTLNALCQSQRTSLLVILQTAWAAVLARFLGTDAVTFVSVVKDGKSVKNGVCCASWTRGSTTLHELLSQLSQWHETSLPHQDMPLKEIENLSNVVPDTGVRVNQLGEPSEPLSAARDKRVIEAVVQVNADSIDIVLEYNASALSSSQVQSIAGSLEKALQAVTNQGATPVSQVDLCSDKDREQVFQWNADMPVTINECVHTWIERKALEQPHAPAAAGFGGDLTYQQLNNQADHLAAYLQGLGVGPDSYVALCFDKATLPIVAMLAVFKAGGAYVALNPQHPVHRQKVILNKIEAQVVLAGPAYVSTFSGLVKHSVAVTPDFIDELAAERRAKVLVRFAQPECPAVVVFTSGSTGEPKGIVVEHRALMSSMIHHAVIMRLDSSTRALQFATYTFDLSVGEIFNTLIHGGCVCVPSEEERMDDLEGFIRRLDVNWALLTPTVQNMLTPTNVPCLKTVSTAGESQKQEIIAAWADHVQLNNMYGPAETTILCAGRSTLKPNTPASNIGLALGALQWITDPMDPNQLCPVGAIGEVLIEGPGLARGYLRDEEKTSAAFIENPSWVPDTNPPRRFYRSADLGYLSQDGTFNIVGRRDTQVKINGQRIELGEIEFHLKNLCSGWQAAVAEVIKPKVQNEQPTLAAFIHFEDEAQPENSLLGRMSEGRRKQLCQLKEDLALHLPSYMTPSLFVPMAQMPTTLNGKLDRRSLRDLAADFSTETLISFSLASANSVKREPTTAGEKTIANLWVEVLKISYETIGLDDSFFQLGGDSIAAMKLSAVARSSGLSLTVSKIFRHPTLEGMSKVAEELLESESESIKPFSLVDVADISIFMDELSSKWGLERSDIEDAYPATALQEGLMAITQAEPGTYIYQNVYKLPAEIDLARFRTAWESVVKTTEILRTTIVPVETAAGTYQVVTKSSIDWKYPTNVEKYLAADAQQTMQYGDSLARYALIPGIKGATFVWTAHHALYDGWSLPLLWKRVEEAYKNNGLAQPHVAPFNRFIAHLQNTNAGATNDFWKSYLSSSNPPKFPQLPSQTYQPRVNNIHHHEFALKGSSSSGVTASTLIRSAWSILMCQYSDAGDDVIVGVTVAGRNVDVSSVSEMAAPTITTVPVRVQIDRDETVADLLNKVQTQTIEMMPFEHAGLQNIAKINRECRLACAFQNLLVVQPEEDDSNNSSLGIKKVQSPDVGIYTYALVVQCLLRGDKVGIQVDFDDRVLSSWQVERICSQLEHIVGELRSSPTVKLGDMSMVSQDDYTQIMSWNHKLPVMEERCVHDIISGQVLATPDAPAICSWDGDFTYAEVEQLSNRFARHLVSLGVGPETLVPHCFSKSAWTVIAMLAIIKAGGACVALDPGHPVDRLKGIIADAGADLVVTTPEHSHMFNGLVSEVVALSPEWFQANDLASDSLQPRADRKNPVFVLFTSGSTGKPKGIIIEHGMFASSAAAHSKAFGINAESRVFQFAAHTFDVSVGDIFTSLMKGACICIPSDLERMNNVAGAINRMKANYAFLTPTVANLLRPEQVPTLRTLTLGGEAPTRENVRTWADNLNLILCYGPAECSVYCSANPPATQQSNPAVLGHAIGALIWLVDPVNHDKLTPVGCVGELVVQGATVARGYLNEPQKTQSAFIQDPAWLPQTFPKEYRRIYKTGDLARFNSDGSLSFVARKDTQAKVRGQRVELAEIEVHLSESPEIQHAMVSVPAAGPYKSRLVCILSLQEIAQRSGGSPNGDITLVEGSDKTAAAEMTTIIENRLAEKLPPYMVPAVWIPLKKIPLNLSGKIDRKLLKGWLEDVDESTYQSIAAMATAEATAQPTSDMERMVQAAFSDTLNIPVESVGLNTSFLSVGGDSISAMQVMSRLRSQNVRVTVQDVLKLRTVAALAGRAQYIEQSTADNSAFEAEVLDEWFKLAPIQKLFFQMQPQGQNHFNQSFVLKLGQDISEEELQKALETIVLRHSMLRARFQQVDGSWMQKITNDVSGSFVLLPRQSCSREEMIAKFREAETLFDISQGPVLTTQVCTTPEASYIFLAAHHLVIDLVSWRIIFQDLEDMIKTGKVSSEPTISFQSWTKLQDEYVSQNFPDRATWDLQAPVADLDYWGMQGASNTWGDITTESFTIDAKRTSLLLGDCNLPLRTEPTEIMVAALLHSFRHAFSDRTAPAVYLEGHGREPWTSAIDVSRTVGWFTTMYPISYEASEDKWLDALKRLKDNRRKVADNGWRYFTARSLTDEMEDKEIVFNYLGLYQQLQKADALFQESTITGTDCAEISPTMQRYSLFEISAGVSNGQMEFIFEYNKKMGSRATISSWINHYRQVLEGGIDELMAQSEILTLSDFPLLSMSYKGLENLAASILPEVGVQTIDEIESLSPCSPMQLGLLMSQLKSVGDYEFFTIKKATAREGVDSAKLLAAWQQVIDRHPMLRTIFVRSAASDRPYDQLVLKNMKAQVVELRDSDPVQALRALPPVGISEGKAPHQVAICRSDDDQVFFKLEINHVLIDGTSMAIIERDLRRAYSAQLSSAAPLSYVDYVTFLQQAKQAESLEFWNDYLHDVQPCQFPILNDGREQVQALESIDVDLPGLTKETLSAFSERYGITVANVVQTAWALVLRTFIGTESVCYGYLTSGRDAPLDGIEDAVGPFINMLVCRLDFDPNAPALLALQNMQDGFLKGMAHQYVSLAEMQHALGVTAQGLFNTAMSFQRYSPEESMDLNLQTVYDYDPTEFNITVNVATREEGLRIDLTYWTSKLSSGQAIHIANTYSAAIMSLLSNPDTVLADVNLLSPLDKASLRDWNKQLPSAIDRCMHEVIHQNAVERPNALALESWEATYTYEQLDKVSTRLARLLMEKGISPDDCIPLCFEKSLFTIVALVAVLKAGGGFVLLDPKHPDDRLKGLLEDTNARFLIVSPQTQERCEPLIADLIVVSPKMLDQLPQGGDDLPQTTVTPENIMYVQFTSGSTGKPKGAVVHHKAACSSIEHHGKVMNYGHDSRIFQFSSYTFDAIILEAFTTLYHGGCVCIPSEEDRMSSMVQSMRDMKVNNMFMTPTIARLFGPQDVPSLTTLMLGGEPIPQDSINTWKDHVNLIGGYGPAECCVYCCYNPLSETGFKPEVIGYPVGSVLWIVDADNHDKLVPIGAIGEIVVHGHIVGRGYLNDPARTAASYISAPSWMSEYHAGEQTLYKTGDLGRYNSDGTLTILGRKDTQVKLNGQRIELGEVEHHIKTEFPQVLQVAVDALKPEHGNGRQLLSAFLEFETTDEFQVDGFLRPMTDDVRETMFEIEAVLAQILPPYMVPHLWFPLATMPKSASGKTDRKVLKQLCNGLPKTELQQYSLASGSKKALETPMEKKIAELWSALFTESNFGANDNFFRVGGDSIEAMKLATAARREGLSLSVADIFNNPKLSSMAQIAVAAEGVSAVSKYDGPFSLVGGLENARSIVQKHLSSEEFDLVEDVYPSTSLQEGLLALTTSQANAYVLQAPFKLPLHLDLDRFRKAWDQVVESNPILRTVIVSTETHGTCQVVLKRAVQWWNASTLTQYLEQDKKQPMTYGTPLCRYGLTSDGYFVWTAHHSLYDGWSFALMLEELEKRYEDESASISRPLFAEYIQFLQQQDSADAIAFWKSQLDDASPTVFPQLPSSLYEPDVDQAFVYNLQNIVLSSKLSVTPSTLLGAAWGLTIALLTNSSKVTYGSTRSGRNVNLSQATELMGPTIATVPMPITIDPSMSVEDFLARVQNQTTEAIPFEHLGLQNISKINSACKAACDFQNLFVVQPAMVGGTALGMERVELSTKGLHTYALNVECILSEDGHAALNFEFDSKVIQAYQVQRLAKQFHQVVDQLCKNEGDLKVGDVEAFSQDDEKQVRQWNARPYPQVSKCAQHLVSEQAQLHPAQLAVAQSDGTTLTFGELESLSTLFAHHLSTRGIAPGQIVPICLKKSVWVVVAMLGVIKTGAAFVCLDPSSPPSRMQVILEDVESELIVVDAETTDIFGRHSSLFGTLNVVEIGAEALQAISRPAGNFEAKGSPRDLMYVIFTSGSTGKPKGVMIEHASACSSFIYQGQVFGYNNETRVLQFSALTFDASLMEIFTTLCAGGCVCFPTEEEKQGDIVNAINHLRVNSVMLTPTVLRMIQPEDVPSVKHVVTGGEAVGHDVVRVWSDKVTLKGVYGPTETSMICVTVDLVPGSSPANIGVPLGCQSWITLPDDHNRLAPIGSVGELLIQGPIVGRGYYKNPKQTEEVYIENPTWLQQRFGETGRLYKTGDLVYYAENGSLMIVGRKDAQVKLHGQRIELGEINHKMWSHPAVRQSSVLLPNQGPLKNRLVAVLTLEGTEEQIAQPEPLRPLSEEWKQYSNLQISSIRQALRENLPSYMVPTVFVAVEQMPRQTSGKTDIKQVKKWVDELDEEIVEQILELETTAGSAIPANETEGAIQAVISKVLDIPTEKIVLNRSFISFGGDSITAMKVMNRLRDAGMKLSIKEILLTGSISELATTIAAKHEEGSLNDHVKSTSTLTVPSQKKYPLLCLDDSDIETILEQRLSSIGLKDLNNVEDVYPCSPLQEGLLLAQTKGVGSYNVDNIYEIKPRNPADQVNPHLLAEAWKEVVRRHQILRTIFIEGLEESSAFDQVVLREARNAPIVIQGVEGNAKAFLHGLAAPEFKPTEPWHSLTICSDASGTVCCAIRMHHTLFDAGSMDVVLREVAQAYHGRLSSPAPLYRDYISYLQGQKDNDAIGYWKTYLDGLEPCYFPSINEDAMGLRKPQSLQFNVPGFRRIASFSSRKSLTISSILQTAWALVLRHYTSAAEVCFGYLSHGRDIPLDGVESIVGPMINMMVLRVGLSEDRNLINILEGARDDVLNSLTHQHCSLAEIHHALDLQGRSAFNTTLSFASAAADAGEDTISFENLAGGGSTEYEIAVNASVVGEELQINFSYWSSALSDQQAKAVAQSFSNFIDILTRSPEASLREIDFSSGAMKDQLLRWNSTPYKPVRNTVHELFHRAALKYPDNAAICSTDGNFTYSELDNLTTRFAAFLRARGVGPEILVPVCFNKSCWTIVSMLSILKAGGACVPLDPSHPPARLQEVISRCEATLILAAPQFVQRLTDKVSNVIAVTEALMQSLPDHSSSELGEAQPENAAFVPFTSGSTGLPKGIILDHMGLCTMFLANASVVGIGPNTRTFQYAAYTFDVSIAETYITLTHGGCVCVPTDAERMNDIPGAITRMEANWTFLTPSVASLLKPTDVPTLKTLTLGGEAISRDLHSTWADKVRLINSYGPAECSIWTSNQQLFPESSCADIGAGITCYLWVTEPDNHDRLVPIGCVGELVVQGPNLARGYLKDEEKTAAAYIDTPAWLRNDTRPAAKRVYKTGDLVRHCPDGRLEFVGRKDTQIKFHGQRIEIGEVEYQLRARLPENTQVAVEMIKPLSQGSRQILAGFIMIEGTEKVSLKGSSDDPASFLKEPDTEFKNIVRHLEQSLTETLPAYMIPSVFIDMVNIPRNTSMKIDRKALRNLGANLSLEQIATYSFVQGEKRAPETAMEKRLQELWASVLKISPESVGADDSFFRIGGDSIGAMQLVSAARKAGLSITVGDIFQHQKLCEMANVVTTTDVSVPTQVEPFSLLPKLEEDLVDLAASKVGIQRNLLQDVYPCTPLQEGLMSLTARDHGLYTLQAVYRLPNTINVQEFQLAWMAVAEELDILRTRLVDLGRLGSYQVVLSPAISQIRWTYGDNLTAYLRQDREIPVSYGTALARYAIIQEEDQKYFVWTAHHAIYDGWSLGLMMDLVEQRYLKKSTTPSPPFNTFIHWLTNLDKSATRQYWKSTFDACSAPQFPSVPKNYRTRAKGIMTHSISLPQMADSDITVPTILRTAWALNISQYTRSDDVVFGMTQTGRNAPVPGSTEIVAPLITTVPVRLVFDRSQTVKNLLQDVQKQMVAMIPHEHVGLQNIAKFSPECQAACKFENLILVQTQQDQMISPIGLERIPVTDLDIPAFGIVAECEVADGQVLVSVGYDTNVVSEKQMSNILHQFDFLVNQIGGRDASTKPLKEVQLLGDNDIQMLEELNQSPDDRVYRLAHELIHERAQLQPEAIAIDSQEAQISYGELDDLSTRLAYFLTGLGAGPDKIIPLFFRRSPWAMVAMLAVMKSGSAFVFLDPSHPVDRLEFVLEQIDAKLVLTSPDLEPTWRGKLAVFCVTPASLDILPSHGEPPVTAVTPDNIIYCIFTSGSTGRPKGCVIEHSNFLSGAVHHAQKSRISQSSRIMQIAPYTFDVSILEMLTGLIGGGCICLPRDFHQGARVSDIINDLNITWTFMTPSVARTIAPSEVPSLRTLILGGEALAKVDIQTWAGKLHLINGYGPSECSVAVACNEVSDPAVEPANIGSKMGCNIWVVDGEDHDILLPMGAVGELLVEGAIVGRGYLHEPEKTAAAFIENPRWVQLLPSTSSLTPRRFYKTGDLVRLNEDGTIHFVGRKDTQFKLRGLRIEMGEIEHHAGTFPGIKHGVVAVPRAGRMKESIVVVYTLNDHDDSQETSDLRPLSLADLDASLMSPGQLKHHLATHLPPYMVPQTFIGVGTLPLLPSGKIDRSKLQKWLENMDDSTNELIAAQSGTTASHEAAPIDPVDTLALTLSESISQLLAGDDEAYLESLQGRNIVLSQSGLNSITVVSLRAMIRDKFDVNLSIERLMDSTVTIQDVARMIEQGDNAAEEQASSAIDLLAEADVMMESLIAEASDVETLPQPTDRAERVLLTGATGFLGSEILRQLLVNPDVRMVVAIVRARDEQHAMEKIVASASAAQWWQEEYRQRVSVWVGDLAAPLLGLSAAQWAAIEGRSTDADSRIDAIIHNGAMVHWGADYHRLRAVNVSSVVSLLAALTRSPAPPKFTFVSGGHVPLDENITDEMLAAELAHSTGYGQSKFVADLVVKRFAQKYSTTAASIVKPGLIVGTAQSGVSNTDDFLWRVVASAVETGGFNAEEPESVILLAGAQQVASIVIANQLSRDGAIKEPRIEDKVRLAVTTQELWRMLIDEFGYALQPMGPTEWLESMKAAVHAQGESHRLWPVLHFLEGGGGYMGQPVTAGQPNGAEPGPQKDELLASLRKSITYMRQIGYFPSDEATVPQNKVVFGRTKA